MLAASFCRELHFTVLPSTINSRVPRCLFGSPSAKETMDLLQDALDIERTRFTSKWGVDPRSENDKENILPRFEKVERSPRKRCSPYSRQTNIHDYWKSRKLCEVGKKSSNNLENSNCNKQQNSENKTTSSLNWNLRKLFNQRFVSTDVSRIWRESRLHYKKKCLVYLFSHFKILL